MEWDEELYNESNTEVDIFLNDIIDEQINIMQENQWLKYDESCAHIKYSLLIKTIYDLIINDNWTSEMILNDCTHHIEEAKKFLDNQTKESETSNIQKEITEEEFMKKLKDVELNYLD